MKDLHNAVEGPITHLDDHLVNPHCAIEGSGLLTEP